MTKDELIEQLALAMAKRQGHDATWLGRQPTIAAMYRGDAEVCLPLIVAFVAEWIEENASHMIAREAAEKWREEMT